MSTAKKDQMLVWLIASLVLFALACATPALQFERTESGQRNWSFGIGFAAIGWMGLLIGQFGWFANLPLALGWLLFGLRRKVGAAVCGGLAILLALDTLRLFYTPFGVEDAHNPNRLAQLGPGYYCWVASMIVVFVGALQLKPKDRPPPAADPQNPPENR